jgi:hypothetical protein
MIDATHQHVYLGTIDDVVKRFPWKFAITPSYLDYTLRRHLLSGHHVLLNDGYLINHPVARDALTNPDHLLRRMLKGGAVSVVARGYSFQGTTALPKREYGLAEMPEIMAPRVKSYDDLIKGRAKGVPDWSTLRAILGTIDRELVDFGNYLSWSPYDTVSGYLALSRRLIDDSTTAESAGLERLITDAQFQQFLRLFVERMQEKPTKGPRDTWEDLAIEFSEDPDVTNVPKMLLNGLMRLANEIYHYNFGAGLTSAYGFPIRVETQPSGAFKSLLLSRGLHLEKIEDLPLPFVPQAIINVSPDRIVGALQVESRLIQARSVYILKLQEARRHSLIPKNIASELKYASDQYSEEIVRAFSKEMQTGTLANSFEFVFSELRSKAKSLAIAAVTAIAAPYLSDEFRGLFDLVGYGLSAVLVFRIGNRMKPLASDQYRIVVDKIPTLPAPMLRRSLAVSEMLSKQTSPISLELSQDAVAPIVSQMKLFKH